MLRFPQLIEPRCWGFPLLVRVPWARPFGREGGSILSGSIGSTPEIELLSPILALARSGDPTSFLGVRSPGQGLLY